MKRFLKSQDGSALIWSLFIILILCTLSVVVYSGLTVYSKYQTCENELQRAAIVTVDMSMENSYVRDMQLDVPVSAEELLEENLTESEWAKEDNGWVKYDGDEILYSLEDMKVEVSDMTMKIDAMFAMPLPWAIGNAFSIQIPMRILTSIMYVN